jgi:N-formylglutamate amidohydrolase
MPGRTYSETRASPPWEIEIGEGPVVAVALHAGHEVSPEVARCLALPESVRLREEDPGTELFTELGVTRVVVHRSRFQVDLNRPREAAVYRTPEAAWGLGVWRDGGPPEPLVERALAEYDAFYEEMEELLAAHAARWGRFAVYDLHSYNHRRAGPQAPPEDPAGAPEINVGTGALDRDRWAPVVERFMAELACCDFYDRRLDVRENVRFRGGHFPAWVARTFPRRGCPLAIEVKKTYLDEWTGEIDLQVAEGIRAALARTVPGVTEVLRRVAHSGLRGRYRAPAPEAGGFSAQVFQPAGPAVRWPPSPSAGRR